MIPIERQTKQWTISLPPMLSKQASDTAKRESRTKSELVREALRQYLEGRGIAQLRQRASRHFLKMGIRTEEDIERLVDEGRK